MAPLSILLDVRFRIALAVLSLSLCILIDLVYFPNSTVFPDEQRFLASASGIVSSASFGAANGVAWEMPGAAAFFALFVFMFSDASSAIVPIRLCQALLLLSQVFLLGNIAARIFQDRLAGIVAFAMAAFYPFLLFYQGLVLSETLFNTFLIAAFACLFWWRDRGMKIDASFVLVCVCFALATYTKATLTLLPPFLLAAATIGAHDRRLALRAFLVSALIYVALLTPWWVRNYSLLGAFVPFTTSASQNLYLGNNPNNPRAGIDWNTDVNPTEVAALNAIPGEIERQHAYSTRATQYIADDPAAFVRRAVLKFVRFWNVVPNASEFNSGIYGVVSVASFGPVLILAILSIAMLYRRLIVIAPLLILFGYFTMVHMITIASLRYRLPLEPFLIVLAAYPIATVLRRWAKLPA